jgi:RES domain-containing protein
VSQTLPRTTPVRAFDTLRLIPSQYVAREDSVLADLAEEEALLADLVDLDNATNERLRAECGLAADIGVDELVFGVPNFRLVNAAFTHARPEGSRFNSADRGAWYCSLEIETALAEVSFHKTVEYQEIGRFDDSVNYTTLLADITSELHDLRNDGEYVRCLDPRSYLVSQRLAAMLLDAGSLGVIYPSARRKSGTNLACFRPAIVGNVRRGGTWRFTWTGSQTPRVEAGAVETGERAAKRGLKPRRG